jgi:hypothetical protein
MQTQLLVQCVPHRLAQILNGKGKCPSAMQHRMAGGTDGNQVARRVELDGHPPFNLAMYFMRLNETFRQRTIALDQIDVADSTCHAMADEAECTVEGVPFTCIHHDVLRMLGLRPEMLTWIAFQVDVQRCGLTPLAPAYDGIWRFA